MMSSNSNLQAWQELTETGIKWRVHQGECHRLAVEFQRSVEADPLLWVLVFQLLNTLSCCIHPPTHISCIVLRWVRDCVSRFRFFSSFSETVTLSSTRDFAKFPCVAQSAPLPSFPPPIHWCVSVCRPRAQCLVSAVTKCNSWFSIPTEFWSILK